jgi:hypothetical protein
MSSDGVCELFLSLSLSLHNRNQRRRLEQQSLRDSATAKVSSSALTATDEEIFNNKLSLIRNIADMQLAIYFCFPNSTWPSQWVGFFGVVNAVTGGMHTTPSSFVSVYPAAQLNSLSHTHATTSTGFQIWRGFHKAS